MCTDEDTKPKKPRSLPKKVLAKAFIARAEGRPWPPEPPNDVYGDLAKTILAILTPEYPNAHVQRYSSSKIEIPEEDLVIRMSLKQKSKYTKSGDYDGNAVNGKIWNSDVSHVTYTTNFEKYGWNEDKIRKSLAKLIEDNKSHAKEKQERQARYALLRGIDTRLTEQVGSLGHDNSVPRLTGATNSYVAKVEHAVNLCVGKISEEQASFLIQMIAPVLERWRDNNAESA